MARPMYFQWQNEVLRKTIYPMRLQKLRDFLLYYKEVDLWAEYKNCLRSFPKPCRRSKASDPHCTGGKQKDHARTGRGLVYLVQVHG